VQRNVTAGTSVEVVKTRVARLQRVVEDCHPRGSVERKSTSAFLSQGKAGNARQSATSPDARGGRAVTVQIHQPAVAVLTPRAAAAQNVLSHKGYEGCSCKWSAVSAAALASVMCLPSRHAHCTSDGVPKRRCRSTQTLCCLAASSTAQLQPKWDPGQWHEPQCTSN